MPIPYPTWWALHAEIEWIGCAIMHYCCRREILLEWDWQCHSDMDGWSLKSSVRRAYIFAFWRPVAGDGHASFSDLSEQAKIMRLRERHSSVRSERWTEFFSCGWQIERIALFERVCWTGAQVWWLGPILLLVEKCSHRWWMWARPTLIPHTNHDPLQTASGLHKMLWRNLHKTVA